VKTLNASFCQEKTPEPSFVLLRFATKDFGGQAGSGYIRENPETGFRVFEKAIFN
jgi:hypothetical protein